MVAGEQSNTPDCYHCGLPVTTGARFCAEFDGVQCYFCCPACQIVATTIVESGLASFYQYQTRSRVSAGMDTIEEVFSAFDDSDFQQRFVSHRQQAGKLVATTDLLIGGMHCAACVWLLEQYLSGLPGVEKVSVSFTDQRATIAWQADRITLSAICQSIASLGYQPEPYTANDFAELQRRENHQLLRRLGVAGLAMMQVGMFAIALYAGALQGIAQEYRDFMRWISMLVATPVVFYCAKPFFIGAWRGLVLKTPGMDLPVAIAIGLAYVASCRATIIAGGEVYFDSVAMFTFLLLAGRYLEMRARHYSGRLSRDVASLLPSAAIRLVKNELGVMEQQLLPLFKIQRDDQLLVKAGQIIPADGRVIEGYSSVNEAQLTGEFMPQTKSLGDQVVAGTINGSGVLTISVESTGADLQLQSIKELVNRAQLRKPKLVQLADRFASYFIIAVLVLAVITYFYWLTADGGRHDSDAFWIMLSVLVVSCPCALSLATPAAMTAATNRLRTLGVLVTDSHVWEKMPTLTDVVCDKTGTLTLGELSLARVKPLAGLNSDSCMKIAAALEAYSEHPIARAFSSQSVAAIAASDVKLDVGQGIQGFVDGAEYRLGRSDYAAALYGGGSETPPDDSQWILLSNTSTAVCWFQLQDTLRDDAAQLIEGLRQRGLGIHLLSGDNSGAARQLGEQLGMDYCVDGASPQQKLDYIHGLQQRGARVLMLGDGINDVPVLAAADVSVAMVNASNLAKTHADSILLSGRLVAVFALMDMAGRARKVIRQNISWALGYNLIAIPLAAMAMIPPYLAAIGMSLSSLVVVLNALRLQRSSTSERAITSHSPVSVGVP